MIVRRLEPHYAWIAAGISVVILYGSFYPFQFYRHADPRGPLGVLLASGWTPTTRDDVVANILLYIPLGFFAAYSFRGSALAAVAAATAAGCALSLFVELAQFYDAGRFQELSDLYTNALGTLVGAAGAVTVRRRIASPYLALMLACWLGSRWYATSTGSTSISALGVYRFFAAWLAVALMLETLCGEVRSRVGLPLALAGSLLVCAVTGHVDRAELAGGGTAVLLWSTLLWRLPSRAMIVAALFVSLVTLLALQPFHFSEFARSFGWVPFRSFLEAGTETAIRAFFEKAFLYGGMVWLLVRAGVSPWVATAFGGALVFCLRLSQVYLPGRSAEITDALLLLMLAAMMKLTALARDQPYGQSASP